VKANTNTQHASLAYQFGDPSLATQGLNMRIDIASRRFAELSQRLSDLSRMAAANAIAAEQQLQYRNEMLKDELRRDLPEEDSGSEESGQAPPHYYSRTPSER